MDRDICLGVLKGCRVGKWDCKTMYTYWDRLTMVAQVGGGFWGVTQGDPLSPTIFNIVVYAVSWIAITM